MRAPITMTREVDDRGVPVDAVVVEVEARMLGAEVEVELGVKVAQGPVVEGMTARTKKAPKNRKCSFNHLC